MAYSAADLTAMEQARLQLITGTQAVSVAFADRSISYNSASLDQLEASIKAAQADIAGRRCAWPGGGCVVRVMQRSKNL